MKLVSHKISSNKKNANFYLLSDNNTISSSFTINDIEAYDNRFLHFYLSYNQESNNIDVTVKKQKYGKIVLTNTSSYEDLKVNQAITTEVKKPITTENLFRFITETEIFNFTGDLTNNWLSGTKLIFGDTNKINRFTLQEVRYWNKPLNDDILNEHTLSPHSYHSNTPTGSYYDLSLRVPFIDKFDVNITQSILSEHPDYHNKTLIDNRILSASFFNLNKDNFEGINETHYIVNPSIGNRSIFSDRIIIDKYQKTEYDYLILDKKLSVENNYTNLNNTNNNRVGIYFSPQNVINEDIFKHMGYFRIDNYIGDPKSLYDSSYPHLKAFAKEYWKKYQTKNNTGEYLRLFKLYDFSIFSQINNTLAERSNKILGLLIEPNILERNRIKTHLPTREKTSFDINITGSHLYSTTGSIQGLEANIIESYTISSNVTEYTSSINTNNVNILSTYNQYSTTIHKYKDYFEGSQYSFNEIIFNVSHNELNITNVNYYIDALNLFVSGTTQSKHRKIKEYFYSSSQHAYLKMYYSSSYIPANVQDYLPTSIKNLKYKGCKVTSANINVNNNDVINNKPTIQVITVNTGELIASKHDSDGNFDVI